jgi:hypothetical protein
VKRNKGTHTYSLFRASNKPLVAYLTFFSLSFRFPPFQGEDQKKRCGEGKGSEGKVRGEEWMVSNSKKESKKKGGMG